jgi:long-chain acyl-CoA synthetase
MFAGPKNDSWTFIISVVIMARCGVNTGLGHHYFESTSPVNNEIYRRFYFFVGCKYIRGNHIMSVQKKIAESSNLAEAVRIACELFPDLDAQMYKDDAKLPGEFKYRRTFRAMYQEVITLGRALIEIGVTEGAMVSVLSENRPEWNITDFANLHNGFTTVGIYTNDSIEHIEFKMLDTQSAVLFIEDKSFLEKVLEIPAANIPSVRHIVIYDTAGIDIKRDPRLMSYSELMERGRSSGESARKELDRRAAGLSLKTLARLVYTSGTSGNPKGAMLTHGNLLSNAADSTDSVDMQPRDVLISYLPEAHVLQTILTLDTLLCGGCLGYSFRKTLTSDLPQLRPTLFPGVQRVWAKIHLGVEKMISSVAANLPEGTGPAKIAEMIRAKLGLDKARILVSGAGKLEPYTYDFFKNKIGLTIFLGYGLSETSPVICVNNERFNRPGSSGRPIPEVEVKIVDERRKELKVGEIGEIATRGPNVFVGYYNQQAKYHSVMDGQGWFYTGDRGYVDVDGYVFVLGRAGHRVKFSDGEHHDLEEIASRFMNYTRMLQQIAVVGEGKDYPVAIVSMTDEEDDLRMIAARLGVPYTNRNEFAYDLKAIAACRDDFEQARKKTLEIDKVSNVEDIKKALYIRPMSEDNGEKTPTQKTRLNFIHDRYKDKIEELYISEESFLVYNPE